MRLLAPQWIALGLVLTAPIAMAQTPTEERLEGSVPVPNEESVFYTPVGENSYGCTFYVRTKGESLSPTSTAIYFRAPSGEFSMDGAACRAQLDQEVE